MQYSPHVAMPRYRQYSSPASQSRLMTTATNQLRDRRRGSASALSRESAITWKQAKGQGTGAGGHVGKGATKAGKGLASKKEKNYGLGRW